MKYKQINRFLKDLSHNQDDSMDISESKTVQNIICEILSCLQWDKSSLELEYTVKNCGVHVGFADVVLMNNNKPKVIIEAKKPSINLKESSHENDLRKEQLLCYLTETNAKIGVLTNGFYWAFFLPPKKGEWRIKQFYEIDLLTDPLSSVGKNLSKFLCKQNILNKKAYRDSRKCVDKCFKDTSPMGMNDDKIIEKINSLKDPETHKDTQKLRELEVEAEKRDILY